MRRRLHKNSNREMDGVLDATLQTQEDINPSSYTRDINLDITSKLVYTYLHEEIISLLNQKDYTTTCLRSNTIKKFIEKLEIAHFNTIGRKTKTVQELFLLHQICKAFYQYNTVTLNLSHQDFRAKILYPNIVYILVRRLHNAHKFLQNTIRAVYFEISRKSYGLIQKYAESYYLDHDMIKTDILYEFLGNLLKKLDPLIVDNINYFYKQVFRNIFYYYFKRDQKTSTSYASLWDIDTSIGQLINSPVRLSIYRDVLYSQQIERICKESPTLAQINYNYNIFKNVIINNELQNMYLSSSVDILMLTDNQYKLLKIYNNEQKQDRMMEELKNLPLIYKLLKCVHIINPKVKPYNEMLIKPELLKTAVLEELIHPFRNMFNENHVYGILEKISENFVDNILSGEYINLLTLSSVKINHISFIQQIRKFVNICINGVLDESTDK